MDKGPKEVIDDLIKWTKENHQRVILDEIDDEDGENLSLDCIYYYDLESFIKHLQIKHLGHVNPAMYPLWDETCSN